MIRSEDAKKSTVYVFIWRCIKFSQNNVKIWILFIFIPYWNYLL